MLEGYGHMLSIIRNKHHGKYKDHWWWVTVVWTQEIPKELKQECDKCKH
jgi:hypothetical protein